MEKRIKSFAVAYCKIGSSLAVWNSFLRRKFLGLLVEDPILWEKRIKPLEVWNSFLRRKFLGLLVEDPCLK